ncbi:MAG: tetratricopeptide repeat protein [Bacteroidales bacterium]|nr:tetratricopeptide repeat protein [Bacteroidales bacterium]
MRIIYKKLSILFLFLLIISFHNYASLNDSIPDYIKNITDTSQIIKIINYAKKTATFDKDSASTLFILAENAAKSLGNEEMIIVSLFEHGYHLFRNGEHDEAFRKLQQSYDKSFQLNYEKYLYLSKMYLGLIYLFKSNYNLATDYFLQCLEYFERQKDYKAIAGIYLNLTYIQVEQKDLKKAEEYANLSYEYAILAKCDEYISKSLLNIGEMYFLKSEYYEAINYYRQSLSLAEKINYEDFKITIFLNIGETYTELNMLDSALIYAEKVVNYKKYNDASIFILPKGCLLLSEIYELKKNYKRAKNYAYKALKHSDSAKVYQFSATAYDYLSRIYAKTGDYETAFKYKEIYTKIHDSIFTEEKYRIQNDLEVVYENSKKQKTIDELSKENEIRKLKNQRSSLLIYILIFILLLAIFIALLFIKQNRNRAKRKSIELEQKLLRTQMNPHFIFNSISSIQDFILNNNPLEASSYLSDFAKLMRAILTNSSDNFISLKNEIETVEHYLKLQHLRMSDKFDYKIIVSELIDKEGYKVPPMLMQPFIENSIIHGIMKKDDGKGLITVSYSLNSGFLIMETQDNGIGRKSSKEHNSSNHQSKAVDITIQRINLLSKKYKQNITFEIIDLKDNDNNPSGTLVRFMLPII